jgi:hypothetical protein
LTVSNIVPERISDVGVLGNYAYLGAANQPCGKGGVYVIDISDPSTPTEVGFIATAPGSFVGEGVQAVTLNTRSFQGDALIINNEVCAFTGEQIGGFSIYDVTNPASPVALVEGAGDLTPSHYAETNQIHSAFAWQPDSKAYVVIVDDEESADVDIFDITDPRAPVQIAEVGLENWPEARNSQSAGIGNFHASFLHDMVVKKINGHWMMLLSYWDAGFIVLNVDDPTSPIFVNDTDFTMAGPGQDLGSPEGNAHQAEWSYDNQFILGADEDTSTYRAIIGIDSGLFAGQSLSAVEGNSSAQLRRGKSLSGRTYFVGRACDNSLPPLAPGPNSIAVIERGTCSVSEKVKNAHQAGYTARIVFNGDGSGDCETLINRSPIKDVPFLSVSRSSGFALLGITGYDPANCPKGSNPALPTPGTAGETVTLSTQFDGWGYVHLFNARTLQEIDTYAVAEALDPAFANGFGSLSVHEVATDPDTNLAYLSYYDAGFRVIRFGASGIEEVGHYIDAKGNDFWGVQVFRLPDDPTQQTYIAASDRNSGLWILKYTGPMQDPKQNP